MSSKLIQHLTIAAHIISVFAKRFFTGYSELIRIEQENSNKLAEIEQRVQQIEDLLKAIQTALRGKL